MAIISPSAVNTTLVQDGQTNAISAASMRTVVNSLGGMFPVIKTGSYTLTIIDFGCMFEFNLSSAGSLTIPTNANVPFDVGVMVGLRWVGTVQPAFLAASGVTLRSTSPTSALTPRALWCSIYAHKRGANEWVIDGEPT